MRVQDDEIYVSAILWVKRFGHQDSHDASGRHSRMEQDRRYSIPMFHGFDILPVLVPVPTASQKKSPEEIQAPRPSPEISACFEPEKGVSMFRILRLSPKKGIRSPWYGPRVYERVDASNKVL